MPTFRPGKPHRLLGLNSSYDPGTGEPTVVWDLIESEGEWDPASSSSTVVAEIAGLYLAVANASRSSRTSAGTCAVSIYLNGGRVGGGVSDSSTAARWASGSWVGNLASGDALHVTVNGLGAGSQLLAGETNFSVVRIGPVRWT